MPGLQTQDHSELLGVLERYYDEVPRASARALEVGPFTLFLRIDSDDWPFYARPRLGHQGPFTADDVRRVRERQREVDAPESFEWVHETTPALTATIRHTDLHLGEHPLMVLGDLVGTAPPAELRIELLGAGHPLLGEALAVISAGFEGTDQVGEPRDAERLHDRLQAGTYRLVAAVGPDGVVAGGSHAPRGGVTELTGIAVLPSARSRGVGAAVTAALVADARDHGVETVFLSAGTQRVADIYARVGFERVATACIAEPRGGD